MSTIKSTDLDALAKMVEFEQGMTDDAKRLGWSWQDVKVYPATIQKLMLADLVEMTYNSNRYKNYLVTEKGRQLLAGNIEQTEEQEPENLITEDLFVDIVGYEDLKTLLRESLQLDDPVHVLMWGPPALSKSMFLEDIEMAAGNLALPLLGGTTSKAGMWDLLSERRPRFLLIDEIEKMKLEDQTGLYSLMANQRIIRAKVGRMIEESINCTVIAAANSISHMSAALLSRFWKYPLKEYNSREFIEVVQASLVRREYLDKESAHTIAMGLVTKTHDVRDAVRVARLSKRMGVLEALDLFNKSQGV